MWRARPGSPDGKGVHLSHGHPPGSFGDGQPIADGCELTPTPSHSLGTSGPQLAPWMFPLSMGIKVADTRVYAERVLVGSILGREFCMYSAQGRYWLQLSSGMPKVSEDVVEEGLCHFQGGLRKWRLIISQIILV